MAGPLVVIFHQPPRDGEPPLTGLLAEARHALTRHQVALFGRNGVRRVLIVAGRDGIHVPGTSFGQRLAGIVADERPKRGVIVLGSGAVPLLRGRDAEHLVAAARGRTRVALTNNRYSSDICAVPDARSLRDLPALPTDNALPRWLGETAGYRVRELPGRDRLAIDLDTPLDLALLGRLGSTPRAVRRLARSVRLPRAGALRAIAADPRKELLVVGRTSARTLRWLERHTSCRVRCLVEERGLKASAAAAAAAAAGADGTAASDIRPPRSVLGRLLAVHGPEALEDIVEELADGAVIDTRVLLADRLGADEGTWPSAEDRFSSDLLLPDRVADPWLAALTRAAADAAIPIMLGAHTLVGPGIRVLLSPRAALE